MLNTVDIGIQNNVTKALSEYDNANNKKSSELINILRYYFTTADLSLDRTIYLDDIDKSYNHDNTGWYSYLSNIISASNNAQNVHKKYFTSSKSFNNFTSEMANIGIIVTVSYCSEVNALHVFIKDDKVNCTLYYADSS